MGFLSKHAGFITIIFVIVAGLLTVGFCYWIVASTKESVCRPVLRLVEKPEPVGLTPSQAASFEYNHRTYAQLYVDLGC